MKKSIYLSVFFLVMGFNAFSQDYYYMPDSKKSKSDTTKTSKRPIFRIKGGINLATQFEKDDQEIYGNNPFIPGFHIGITRETPLANMISFETGLLLSTKGYSGGQQGYFGSPGNYEHLDIKGYEALLYLDIPAIMKFYIKITEDSKFYGVFGPYGSIGLIGIDKTTETNLDSGEKERYSDVITFGYSDQSYYNLFDLGLTTGAGIEINSVQIGLAYNFGLVSIEPSYSDGYQLKNRVFQLSIAYKFKQK